MALGTAQAAMDKCKSDHRSAPSMPRPLVQILFIHPLWRLNLLLRSFMLTRELGPAQTPLLLISTNAMTPPLPHRRPCAIQAYQSP